jgi:hypothetical protein
VVEQAAAPPQKSYLGAILAPIFFVLVIVGLAVAKTKHELNEQQWEDDIELKETELLWAMGSCWEIPDEELADMGGKFIQQLPMCPVCGERAMQAQIDRGSCCIFEMGKNSVFGDVTRFLPMSTENFNFSTKMHVHPRMKRSEAVDILRHYGLTFGDFFVQHVADGGERRAGQLSVVLWAVGKIDEDAPASKLDADGTNNTWVRTCNIIEQLDDSGDDETKQIFKIDGHRINADNWNDFFDLLVADEEGYVFDAAPTRFLPIDATEHLDGDAEGGNFGERRASTTVAVSDEHADVKELKKSKIAPGKMRGSLKKAVVKASAKSKGKTGTGPAWAFEKETGYMTTDGVFFEPGPQEVPNVDWPPRADGRPPKLQKGRIKEEGAKAAVVDAFASATSTKAAGAFGKAQSSSSIAETSFMNDGAAVFSADEAAFNDGSDELNDDAYLNVSGSPEKGLVQRLGSPSSAQRPLSESIDGFGTPAFESEAHVPGAATPAAESAHGFEDMSMDSQSMGSFGDERNVMVTKEDAELVTGFGDDAGEDSEAEDTFGNALEGDDDDENLDFTSAPAKQKGLNRGASVVSTMMLVVALTFSTCFGMASGLSLDRGLVRPPTMVGSDLEEATQKVAYMTHKRFNDKLEDLHKHFDIDDSGYLLLHELVPMFVAAQIGARPTRGSWAASFTQSFARSYAHGISLEDLLHGFDRIGYAGTGSRCVPTTGAGFCPSLPADITHKYLHVLEEDGDVYGAQGETIDCAECTQANAMNSVRWPFLPFTAKEEDKYALHSIFDEIEQGCQDGAFEECMMKEGASCTPCAEETECVFKEALFRVAGGRFTGPPMLVAPHFFPGLQSMDSYAADCNVLLNVQSSLQYEIEESATPTSVKGEAVRLLIEDGSGLCDSDCITNATTRPAAVTCFLAKVEVDPLFKWAGHHLPEEVEGSGNGNGDGGDAGWDPTFYEAYRDCEESDMEDGEKCHARTKGAIHTQVVTFEAFHDFNCARAISIGPPTKLKIANIEVDHAQCSIDASSFAQSTDAVAVFPSGLRTIIKSWHLRPFGIDEYASPFGNDETAPLIDAKDHVNAKFSNSLAVAAMLSGAVCHPDLQVTVTIDGQQQIRNRMLRISPTLVKGLENLMTNSHQKVGIVRGYQTKSEALARGESNKWYRTGAAARVAFAETDARVRHIDLAAEAIRAFHPVVREAGLCLGIGLHIDGVHLDVRPPSPGAASTSIHAWAAGGADMSSAEFKAWAEKLFGLIPLKMPDEACKSAPVDVPFKQRQIFGGVAVGSSPPTTDGGEWCGTATAALTKHFDEVWALVTTRYNHLVMDNRRSLAEVESTLRWCLASCDGGSIQAPAPGSVPAEKIRACNQALHWLPFSVSVARGTCSLVTASSPVKDTACFWGSCVQETELYGLMGPTTLFQPVLPAKTVNDPTCGANERLYGASNPSPMAELLRALFAGHCTGRVTVFVDSPKELLSLESALKTLLVYNPDVVFVDMRISGPAYTAVVKAMDGMVKAWKPTVCKFYSEREFLAPYTMVKIGSNEIKSAAPKSL